MKELTKWASVLALFAWVAPAQAATAYTYQSISFPNGNGSAAACGINNLGQISGWYQDTSSAVHGFIKTGNSIQSIDYPSGLNYTIVRGINDSGQVVGYSGVNAFVWTAGSFSPITLPDYAWIGPFGINNFGVVSGQYSTTDGLYHGFILSSSGSTQLNFPGAAPGTTSASALNNNGDVVGWYQDAASVQHGFYYHAGTYTSVDYPGRSTILWGINDSGVMVGYTYTTDPRVPTGFVYEGGTFTDLAPPGQFRQSQAWSINNAGTIVGSYAAGLGAWVATPHGP